MTIADEMTRQKQLFTLFDIALKAGAPGLAEPSRQALARNLALKLMHMPCDECEKVKAMHRDMCVVNGNLVTESDRLRSALEDITSGHACLPGYSAADAAAAARQALAPMVDPPESGKPSSAQRVGK